MEKSLLEKAIGMMMRTDRMHRCLIEKSVRDIGMHRTAHMILMHIDREKHCPSQREIAEKFSITPAAATGILKNLEKEGYILRTIGKDTRYNEVSITEKGREVVERSKEVFYSVDASMFRGFSDGELQSYIEMLAKIQKNMEERKEENK